MFCVLLEEERARVSAETAAAARPACKTPNNTPNTNQTNNTQKNQGDGTGALSIYGTRYADENFAARHTGAGLLSCANSGPDSNGCQFFVTCAAADWLDGKHVVFGRVLGDGLLVVRKIETVATGPANRPKMPVVIAECGER